MITRFESGVADAVLGPTAADANGVTISPPTICPGDGGGGGTRGRANAAAGVCIGIASIAGKEVSGVAMVGSAAIGVANFGNSIAGVTDAGVANGGVETDGVGRDGYGVPVSGISVDSGVDRRMLGILAGVAGIIGITRDGVAARATIAGLVRGVDEPTVIRMIAPHTLQRARTPFGGTFAGSTRKTERQS